MYWKEMTYGFKKYHIYLIIAILMAMFLSKLNVLSLAPQDAGRLRILALSGDATAAAFLEKHFPEAEVMVATGYEEGMKLLNSKKDTDVLVYHQKKDDSLKVIINPISDKSNYLEYIFGMYRVETDYTLKVLEPKGNAVTEAERLRNIFNSFSFVLTFICLMMPYRMMADERKTLTALVFSPADNNAILWAKLLCTAFIYSVACLYFMVAFDLPASLISVVFLLGLIYSVLGMAAGIFSDYKVVSIMFYPLFLGMTILPMVINRVVDYPAVIRILNTDLWAMAVALLSQLVLLAIVCYSLGLLFKLKLRKERYA